MAAPEFEAAFMRLLNRGYRPYKVVTGTTSATINTASTVAHGLKGSHGEDITPSVAIAFPTSNAGGVYQGAPPTATVIDIRSAVASVPYVALVLA